MSDRNAVKTKSIDMLKAELREFQRMYRQKSRQKLKAIKKKQECHQFRDIRPEYFIINISF